MNWNKKSLLILLSLCYSFVTWSQATLEQANQAYEKANYNFAIEQYDRILAEGKYSPDLYYNLGNAHFKSGNLGRAILNYERALLHRPNDTDTQTNLSIAKARTVDIIQPLPTFFLTRWWRNIENCLSANAWAWLSFLMLGSSAAGVILWLLSTSRMVKKRGFLLGLVGLGLFFLTFALAYSKSAKQQNSGSAVILAKEVALKEGGDADSPDVLQLHEGTKVALLGSIGKWHKVRLPNGERGWLLEGSFEKI